MKILVLMKRFSTNKDMVLQNFGRQIRLFEHLKNQHRIDFLCADYKKHQSIKLRKNGIDYHIEPLELTSFGKFLRKLNLLIKKNRYDIIVGSTTPLLGIVAYFYSKKYKIKMIYELQDNFESYSEYKLPFVNFLDKYIIKHSDIIICVSHTLKNKIKKSRKKQVYVVQNGIENIFRPMNKSKCRESLGLPKDAKIISYIGHIAKLKGWHILLKAFKKVRAAYPDAYLFVSGQVDNGIDLNQENIIYDKLPERKKVAMAINAADVAVIPNPKNKFTEYCFPYKLAEYMACNVPIVTTNIGDVSLLLARHPDSLCKPNSEDLSQKIIYQLSHKTKRDYGRVIRRLSWKSLARKLNHILKSA